MKSGAELDALVTEKVMGLDLADSKVGYQRYSTDISPAWRVVEKLCAANPSMHYKFARMQGVYFAHFMLDDEIAVSEGESIPHAICLAALNLIEARLGR